MVVILLHHVRHILLPESIEELYIIMLGLVDVPVVDVLIHHQQADPVADLQGRFGAGVMGRADSVVAILLQNPQLPFHRIRVADSAQQPIVVMNAGTSENHPLSVYFQAVVAPGQGTHTEGFFRHILTKCHSSGIEVGRFHTPQLGIGNLDVHAPLSAGTGNLLLTVQNLNLDSPGDRGTHPYFHHGRVNGDGADSDAVQFNMCLGRSPQLHRAVDARAGIPPGIGLIRIPGDHLNGVFTGAQEGIQLHIEIGIAIRAEGSFLSIDEHLRLPINTLKFQDMIL